MSCAGSILSSPLCNGFLVLLTIARSWSRQTSGNTAAEFECVQWVINLFEEPLVALLSAGLYNTRMHQHVPEHRRVSKRRAVFLFLELILIFFMINAIGAYCMEGFTFGGALLATASFGVFLGLYLYFFGFPRIQ